MKYNKTLKYILSFYVRRSPSSLFLENDVPEKMMYLRTWCTWENVDGLTTVVHVIATWTLVNCSRWAVTLVTVAVIVQVVWWGWGSIVVLVVIVHCWNEKFKSNHKFAFYNNCKLDYIWECWVKMIFSTYFALLVFQNLSILSYMET